MKQQSEPRDLELERADTVAKDNVCYVSDLACAWLEENAPRWALAPPEWYTAEWRARVREEAQWGWLGEGGVAAAAALLNDTGRRRTGSAGEGGARVHACA